VLVDTKVLQLSKTKGCRRKKKIQVVGSILIRQTANCLEVFLCNKQSGKQLLFFFFFWEKIWNANWFLQT